MIATNEAADVLRHGWQDAALSLAADVPEIAELLRSRLEVAISSQRLDERHLLDTIEEVESMSARAGSLSGEALARRLRRTVYEYLLALDAVRPAESAPLAIPATPPPDGPMVGAEEVAALGHPSPEPTAEAMPATEEAPSPESEDQVTVIEQDVLAEGHGSRRKGFGLRRRGEPPEDAGAPESDTAQEGDAGPGLFVAPRAGFHIVDGDDEETSATADEPAVVMPAFDDAPVAFGAAAEPAVPPMAADPPVEPAPPALTQLTSEDTARPVPELFELTPERGPVSVPEFDNASLGSPSPSPAPDAAAPAEPAAASPEEDQDDDELGSRGWRVRDSRGAARRRVGGGQHVGEPEDDPFGNNPKLAETRRRIEDRLRRKRCDEAAALLQALAQETGGRAVAELAMNAGDRCRALGKSNAALNCYLAASRSDPVYELPLSRLADVCIDAQDTDLAVSYLERIARLYRFRGDDKAALRVYRRIVTVAPYREDVLTLLLNAQSTGRLD